jgi:hypothetical protein
LDIENTEMTAAEVRLELACALYAERRISATDQGAGNPAKAVKLSDQDQRADGPGAGAEVSRALEKVMRGYTNKQITTAQMIAQLLELAKLV